MLANIFHPLQRAYGVFERRNGQIRVSNQAEFGGNGARLLEAFAPQFVPELHEFFLLVHGAMLSNFIILQVLQRPRPQWWLIIQAIEDALRGIAAAHQQVGNLVKQPVFFAKQPEGFLEDIFKGGYMRGDRNRPQRRRQVPDQRVDGILFITAKAWVAFVPVAAADRKSV